MLEAHYCSERQVPTFTTNTVSSGRRYDIDALRVFAFGLLILYHVGMYYVADWGWHIKSDYRSSWLQVPMLVSNQFRMPLIFLISGLAVSFVWGKYQPVKFALRRIWRLFIPLVFGMAVIIAPQNYYEALSNAAIEPGFGNFFSTYLLGHDFPPQAYDGDDTPGWTWNHLWYLPYLLSYTLLLIPLALVLERLGNPLRTAFCQLRGVWLVVVPIIPLLLYGNVVYPRFPYISHAFFDDWYAHAMYFTLFFYGFLIGRDAGLWLELLRLRKAALGLAIVSFVSFYLVSVLAPDNLFAGQQLLESVAVYLNRWLWIVAFLGWGHHLLNRPFKCLPYATEAVYPWYILHQTLIVVAGYQLAQLELGPILEPVVVLTATIVGCMVVHEFIIRRLAILRPLFGLTVARHAKGSGRGEMSASKITAS